MDITNKSQQIIPIETFADAFVKLFKCKVEEIHIESIEENQSAFALYKEEPYQIHTYASLLEKVKCMLVNSDEAQLIHIDIWLEVSTGVLANEQFYMNLGQSFKEKEQAELVNLALSISSFSSNNEEIFWRTLQSIDKSGIIFGEAIVAASKIYDMDRLSDEILELQIVNGHVVYNQFVDGMFEEIILTQNDDDIEFYIYSADGGY